MKPILHWTLAAVPVTAALFSLMSLGQALWIPVKAELAQWLIERSWQQRLSGQAKTRPWPWADTQAVAVLTVPTHGVRQIILEGNSGRNLAFGPVMLDGSQNGSDLVISGHRDTHFRFLQDLKAGDKVSIQSGGHHETYQVSQIEIINGHGNDLVIEPGIRRLSLVTCYPFDSMSAGGPLRYVVTALPIQKSLNSRKYSSSSG
jgi:sortase A